MGPPQRWLATGSRRRAEARLGSRLRMARLFPSAPAEVGVEPSPFKRDRGDDLGSVHNVRCPLYPMFNIGIFLSAFIGVHRRPYAFPYGPPMNADKRRSEN